MKKYFILYKEINNWKIREKKEENKGYSRITNIQKGVSETKDPVDKNQNIKECSVMFSSKSFAASTN